MNRGPFSFGAHGIAPGLVPVADLAFSDSPRLAGRTTAGAGAGEEISVGAGLSLAALTLSSTITQYTDEMAQDAVGGILTDTAEIDLTYNDGAGTITADIKAGSVALARLVNASARSFIAASAAGAWAERSLSANVLTMLDSADNAAIRSNVGAVNIAGDTMTGALNTTGIYLGGAGGQALTSAILASLYHSGGNTVAVLDSDGGNAVVRLTNYLASSSAPQFEGRHARGTLAAPTALNNADQLATINALGYNGSAFINGAGFQFWTGEAWSVGNTGSFFVMSLTANATTTATEAMRLTPAAGLSIFGSSNVVIDANRLLVLRNYTVATLPSASVAYKTAAVSDANTTIILGLGTTVVGGGANKVPVYSDGTNWIIG